MRKTGLKPAQAKSPPGPQSGGCSEQAGYAGRLYGPAEEREEVATAIESRLLEKYLAETGDY